MAKKKENKKNDANLWIGITDKDFEYEEDIEEISLETYNMEKMEIYAANTNYARHLIRLSDSLKTVDRRILYVMYSLGLKPGNYKKSSQIMGETNTLHAHGDGSIYKSLVGLSQNWKYPLPVIETPSNMGSETNPEGFSAMRYTEASLSKYGYECFFDDYDPDCVETIWNSSIDGPEPLSIPTKFPNVLLNGATGFTIGNAFGIPPYNPEELITLTKHLIKDENYPEVYLLPDLPTACNIVDDGTEIKKICETGTGTLRMRADIDIEAVGKTWVLTVSKNPWMTSMESFREKLIELTRKGILPIRDIVDRSIQTVVGKNVEITVLFEIIIDKAHDPYVIRDSIYKLTEMSKSIHINYKVILDGFTLDTFNLRALILAWIDERRGYKRRLLNKQITKLAARISLLEIMIYLTSENNLTKTVKIVRESNSNELIKRLMDYGKMSSFQATKISTMGLNSFTKDANAKYQKEKETLENEMNKIMELIKSEKKIDKIILDELDDMKKYYYPRRSKMISPATGIQVADTDHIIIATNQGMVKKLLMKSDRTTYGSFKNLDYPKHRIDANNMDMIIFYDTKGRMTILPVHEIQNTEMSSYGNTVYDITRLDGGIISLHPDFKLSTKEFIHDELGAELVILSLTKEGYVKKTLLEDITSIKNKKNVRIMKLKENDEMVFSDVLIDPSNIMIYTKKGNYTFISLSDLSMQSKDAIGLIGLKLKDGDECVGVNIIGDTDKYILVITEKGTMKKCEIEYLGSVGNRKNAASYVSTLDSNDNVQWIGTMNDDSKVTVVTRTEVLEYNAEDIPTLSRRAKGQKMIALPVGSNIVDVSVK